MKRLLPLLLLTACSTTQLNQTRAIADPLVAAAVRGYASSHGVPPELTDSLVTPLQNSFWGMLAQAQAQQPIAQGAAEPAVGVAVAKAAAQSPTPTVTQLQTALNALGATP